MTPRDRAIAAAMEACKLEDHMVENARALFGRVFDAGWAAGIGVVADQVWGDSETSIGLVDRIRALTPDKP